MLLMSDPRTKCFMGLAAVTWCYGPVLPNEQETQELHPCAPLPI